MTGQTVTIMSLGNLRDGHRGAYVDTLCAHFDCRVSGLDVSALLGRDPVLVPMIEESFGRYAGVCLVRALLARRTVGLLFRPLPAIEGQTVRLRFKRAMLRVLRRLPGVHTLTILPFAVDPRFAEIASGWIHDLQLWDLQREEAGGIRIETGELAAAIRRQAGGRLVCAAIGRQDKAKGFDLFVRAWLDDAATRKALLFAFGGKVDAACATDAEAFAAAHGFAANRIVSDAELLELYAAADLVWAAYDPDYDQASGIVGRALQLGIPVVVRSGSLIERMCRIERHPHISLAANAGTVKPQDLPARLAPAEAANRAARHKAESIERLRSALGFSG